MSFQPQRLSLSLVAFLTAGWLACSVNESGGGGGQGGAGGSATGGATSSGGTTSSGGSSAKGGTTSSGGSSAAGGTTSSGGSPASGGSSARGGSSAAGGSSASGGNASGGSTPSGGASGGGGSRGGAGGGVTGGSGSGGAVGSGGTAAGGTSAAGGGPGSGGTMGSGGAAGAGGGTPAVDCTDTSETTKNFTKQYEDGALAVTGSTKTYYTMTNWWHKFGGQTVTLTGLSMKLGNTQGASVPSSDGNPMGFPTMFIGTYQSKATVGSNLPKKVSDIKSVPTIFHTNSSSVDTANLNAAYDVWFTASSSPLSSPMANNPGKGGAYLMVWLFKPEQRQPRGGVYSASGDASPNFPATTIEGVPGKWDVWVDKASDPLCISYVASEPIDGLAYDLNHFIQDSVTNQYGITTSMYLSIIFAGFEVWGGGDGIECKQFCAAVN